MQLSDFSTIGTVVRDGHFESLGSPYVTSGTVLAYADTVRHLLTAISNEHITCIVTSESLFQLVPESLGVLLSNEPRNTFFQIHEFFLNNNRREPPFIAGIGENCKIHPSALIASGCRIGDNATIGEQVVIRDPVWIGSNVTIEAGVKVGVEGILYYRTSSGPRLIPHGGYVRIHDNAMLMTNAVVVRSVHDTDLTEVGESSLIGLGTIIGHDAKVGKRVVVSNQCVVARRSIIGDDAFIGTNCTIKENITIGSAARVMAGSVVIDDVATGATVSGNFATDHNTRMLQHARQMHHQKQITKGTSA